MTDNGYVASTDENATGGRPRARDLNEQIRYTMWSVFRVIDRAALAGQPGLAACGAAYDGIGIPACVATAQAAAGQIAEYLRDGRQWERYGNTGAGTDGRH